MKKTAVILFNLGGPDSPEAIKPFLFNLFNDPAIIRLPQPLRYLVAKLISSRREKTAQDIYGKIGGGSPILENTMAQARALENALVDQGHARRGRIKCFVCMRYWHPFADQVTAQVKEFGPEEIILLPLYPQYSTTTTASSLKAWKTAAAKAWLNVRTKSVCCYPDEPGFIHVLTDLIRASLREAEPHGIPRILFSAHGLPKKIVQAGDPYQWQCERTARALVKELAVDGLDWSLCYQSRVGPLKWIGPSTDDEIRRAGADKVPVVIVPISFVSEHSETLVEIDMECRHLAAQSGVPFYVYTSTVSTASAFINGLAALVQKARADGKNCISSTGAQICPQDFSGCCQNQK